VLGALSPSVLNTQHAIAVALANLQRFDEALALHRAQVVARRQLHGPRSAKVSSALNEVANVLQDAGRLDEAVATYHEALALDEQISGRKSIDVAVRLNNLASALEDLGDPAAEALYRESLAIRRSLAGTGRPLGGARRTQSGALAAARWVAARKSGRCWTAAVPQRAWPSCRPRTTRWWTRRFCGPSGCSPRATWMRHKRGWPAWPHRKPHSAQHAAPICGARRRCWPVRAARAPQPGLAAPRLAAHARTRQPPQPAAADAAGGTGGTAGRHGPAAAARQTLQSQQARLAGQHPASTLARRSRALLQRLPAG
jgi:hypothetical protein